MSPIHRVIRTININDNDRLDVVRQDGAPCVILAFVEERENSQNRRAVTLTLGQANKLARDLAGIAIRIGIEDDVDDEPTGP
jgi:hypothetical protein